MKATRPIVRRPAAGRLAEPAVALADIAAFVYTTAPRDTAALLPAGLTPALRRGRAVWVVVAARFAPPAERNGNGRRNGHNGHNGNGRTRPATAFVEYRIAVRPPPSAKAAFYCFRADSDVPLPETPIPLGPARPSAVISSTGEADRVVGAVRSGRGQMRDAAFALSTTAARLPAGSVFADAHEAAAFVFGSSARIALDPAGERPVAALERWSVPAPRIVRPDRVTFQFFEDGLHLRPGSATADATVFAPSAVRTAERD
jgi:hypothetical protein